MTNLDTATLAPLLPPGNQLLYQGQYMADDFADHFTTPVVHVRWWGSYLQNSRSTFDGVKQFLASRLKRTCPSPIRRIPQGTAILVHRS